MIKSEYDQEPTRKIDTSFLRERKLKEQYESEPNGGLTWEEYLFKMNEQDGIAYDSAQTESKSVSKKSGSTFQVKPNAFLFPDTEVVDLKTKRKTQGHFYNNEIADLSQFTYLELCSIAAYILNNEDYRKIKREKFFRPCSCNLQDQDASVFQNKPITLVDPFGFFTIEGFKLLITVAKTIKPDFINELNKR